ncbi:MAG: sodium/proton antiporter NhaB [Pseudomonadota bacterium]|nr:sodium/proton antiporter NhaB [Pseudomonadota bacterium]
MKAFFDRTLNSFLGHSPLWYKWTILLFLAINPVLIQLPEIGHTVAGWALIGEFIFTLAMALKCYPLQPGGLLAVEAVAIGMTSPERVYDEILHNFPVILLLMFMVAAIYFLKDLLLFCFTRLLLGVRSKALLSLLFCLSGAVLSAFLDALTVTAVIITVSSGFYAIYHRVASGKSSHHEHNHLDDTKVAQNERANLEQFRAFLRSLMMHGAVGTALGGVCTLVGEPQNLLIAHAADWSFAEFLLRVSPVSMPVLAVGLATCYLLERTHKFGYGETMPPRIREVLSAYDIDQNAARTPRQWHAIWVQGLMGIVLILGLVFHVAEVGLIGLMVIVLVTSATGITEESRIGPAFEESLPFTALLIVFFAVVAVIHDQHLFEPFIDYVLAMDPTLQPRMLYVANGLLSAISDNVFVATIYIGEVKRALLAGEISRELFDTLAVAINTGTNIPSVATPNGQAAFLFLLTSALAPLIRLSYGRMVWMALPYTLTMSVTGFIALSAL